MKFFNIQQLYPLFFKRMLIPTSAATSIYTSYCSMNYMYLSASRYKPEIDLVDNPSALKLIYNNITILRKYHEIIS